MSEGETVYTNCAELDSSWTPQWSSLVSYWKMNNDWNDSKGSSNGTAAGNAAFSASAKLGSHSGAFDGTGDYVSTTLTMGKTFTWSAWINPTDAAATYRTIMSIGGGNLMLMDVIGGVAAFWSSDGLGGGSYGASVGAGVWRHLVFVREGDSTTNGYKIYLDGIKTGETNSGVWSSTDFVRLGSRAGDTQDFKGSLDDIAIWSVALGATEIKTIYARQFAKYSGQFTSRVIDYSSTNAWDGLEWLTTLPFGKELTGDANNSGTITSADSETHTDYPSLVGSTGSTSDDNLMSGIVGLWHMNESSWADVANEVSDSSGNSNHGRAKNGASVEASGLFNNSAKFDGSNDYIETKDIDVSFITIAAWVKANSAVNGYVVNKTYDGSTVPFSLNVGGGQAGMAFFDGGWRQSGITTDIRGDGKWHHVVGSYDGSTLKYYVDGNLDKSVSYTAASLPLTNNNKVDIGRYANDGGYFGGLIDEVAIWSRALHADEIKQLYRRGANRIKYQVRTCTTADCSDGATWLGNNNTKGTYFSELHNYAPYNYDVNNCSATNLILTGSPSLLFACFTGALSNLTSQQYFQYRAILESDDTSTNCNYGSGATWCSPELKSVAIKP